MTNYEYYMPKGGDALEVAFERYCDRAGYCKDCPLSDEESLGVCGVRFALAPCEDMAEQGELFAAVDGGYNRIAEGMVQ